MNFGLGVNFKQRFSAYVYDIKIVDSSLNSYNESILHNYIPFRMMNGSWWEWIW